MLTDEQIGDLYVTLNEIAKKILRIRTAKEEDEEMIAEIDGTLYRLQSDLEELVPSRVTRWYAHYRADSGSQTVVMRPQEFSMLDRARLIKEGIWNAGVNYNAECYGYADTPELALVYLGQAIQEYLDGKSEA